MSAGTGEPMPGDWFDEVRTLLDMAEAGRWPNLARWPARLVVDAPEHALDIVANQIELRSVGHAEAPQSVRHLRQLLAQLLDAESEESRLEARVREAAIAIYLAAPGEVNWRVLVGATQGATPDDQARRALYWLLVHGSTVDRVVRALSRCGPKVVLAPIARTGLVSQFEFARRADDTRVLDRKKGWLGLAILAADARGHRCCVGTFGLALEALDADKAPGSGWDPE